MNLRKTLNSKRVDYFPVRLAGVQASATKESTEFAKELYLKLEGAGEGSRSFPDFYELSTLRSRNGSTENTRFTR
jgi:hypothetical protein